MSETRRASSLLMAIALVATALVAGCQSMPSVDVPKEVKVQVPVPCIAPADVPQRPAVRIEDDLMAMDTYRRTLAAWSDLTRLRGYAGELEAVVQGCSRIPAASPIR